MTRRSVQIFLVLMTLAASTQAVNYTNEVLEIGVGARALGMGGAYVAVADDSTASYWNPAGLTAIKHMEVELVQQAQESAPLALGTNDVGSQYFIMTGGMTLPDIGSFGVAVLRFGVSGIEQIPSSSAAQYNCATCAPPAAIGTFGTQDLALLLSYARTIVPAVDLGVTAKILDGGTSGLQADPGGDGITGNVSYDYFGLDLGVMVKFGELTPYLKGLNLGVNLQDLLNTGVKWTDDSTAEAVDMNAKSGLAYSLPFDFLRANHTTMALALDMDPKYSTLIHYGAEIWYKDTLAFRAGMRQFTSGLQSNEVSAGASFRFFILQVDYSYIDYELTPIQYMSMLVRW